MLEPVFAALKAAGYGAELTPGEIGADSYLLSYEIGRAGRNSTPTREARVIVVSERKWAADPFRGDWHDEPLPEAQTSTSQNGSRPIIVRSGEFEVPMFLLPAVVPETGPLEACNVVDAFLAPRRLATAIYEKVGLASQDPALTVAEALLVQSNWSVGLLFDLGQKGATTTAAALQTVDARLGKPAAIMLAAVVNRDPLTLQTALQQSSGRAPNLKFAGGHTLLHFAACFPGNVDVESILLEAGCDYNACSLTKATPLLSATWNAPNDVPLLGKGADPKVVTLDGDNVLSVSAWKGDSARVVHQLETGLSPFLTDKNGGHPLYWAAHAGRLDIVRLIVDRYPEQLDVRTGDQGMGSPETGFSSTAPDLPALTRLRRWRRQHDQALGRTALMVAVGYGHKEIVEYLLAHGSCPNVTDRTSTRALHFAPAAGEHSTPIARALIAGGADVNATNVDGMTAVMAAALANNSEVAALLVDRGATINSADIDGRTALHHAAARGHTDVVRELVRLHARPSLFDSDGMTPLHRAVLFNPGSTDTIEALIDCEADADEMDRAGRTPLVLLLSSNAADSERDAAARCLLGRKADPNGRGLHGRSILGEAVVSGDLVLVDLLLRSSAKIAQEGEGKVTPLHMAVIKGHNRIVERLLQEESVSANMLDGTGESPLHDAVRNKNLEAWQLLLGKDGDPWASAEDGPCAALMAARKDQPEFCEPLFQMLDLRRPNSLSHGLALVCASALGNVGQLERLLTAGVPVDYSSPEGAHPLALAILSGRSEVVRLLLEKGAKVNWSSGIPTALSCAAQRGDLDLLRKLLQMGADANAPAAHGFTPVFFAVAYGHSAILEELLQSGAFADARADDGQSPLHVAATDGRIDIAKILVARGAYIDSRDKNGNTPLHEAAAKGNADFTIWLLEQGCDPDPVNNTGSSPLALAVTGKQATCVRLLLDDPMVDRFRSDGEGRSLPMLTQDPEVGEILLAAGVAPIDNETDRSSQAHFLSWMTLAPDRIERLQAQLRQSKLDNRGVKDWLEGNDAAPVRYAELPFYRDAGLVAIPNNETASPTESFIILRSEPAFAVALDWSNAPIFEANDALGWHLDATNVGVYFKFFFFFVRPAGHWLRILEPRDPLDWLLSADEKLIQTVQERLLPITTLPDAPEGIVHIQFTCLYKTVLARGEAYLALKNIDVTPPGSQQRERLRKSQFHLLSDKVLLDGLPVRP